MQYLIHSLSLSLRLCLQGDSPASAGLGALDLKSDSELVEERGRFRACRGKGDIPIAIGSGAAGGSWGLFSYYFELILN